MTKSYGYLFPNPYIVEIDKLKEQNAALVEVLESASIRLSVFRESTGLWDSDDEIAFKEIEQALALAEANKTG